MRTKALRVVVGWAVALSMAMAEVPEELEDLQTEFYLPYSVTEDVDFSVQRPSGFGCYQWY